MVAGEKHILHQTEKFIDIHTSVQYIKYIISGEENMTLPYDKGNKKCRCCHSNVSRNQYYLDHLGYKTHLTCRIKMNWKT